MAIDPLEYSLRAHEILEDGIHLQLSGQASPWSGSALVALRAEVARHSVVLRTLRPMLARRDAGGALPQARRALQRLSAALARLERAHGSLPRWDRLGQRDRELVDGLTAGAAEQLAYVPELIDPRPPRPAQRSFGDERMKRRAFLGSAAALGAGAAIDRVIGAGGGARRGAGCATRPPCRNAADRLRGRPPGGHPHARAAARDLRRVRRDRAVAGRAGRRRCETLSDRARRADRAATTRCSGAPGEGPTPDSGILGPHASRRRPDRDDRLRRLALRRPLRPGRAQAARAEADDDLPRRRARRRGVPRRRARAAVRQQRGDAAQRAARPHARDARLARAALEDRGLPARPPSEARRAAQPARLQGRHRQPGRRPTRA